MPLPMIPAIALSVVGHTQTNARELIMNGMNESIDA